jgi:hypothetical protein
MNILKIRNHIYNSVLETRAALIYFRFDWELLSRPEYRT